VSLWSSIMAKKPTPIVVVANCLPFILEEDQEGKITRKQSAAGVVTAAAPVLVETQGLWVGWRESHAPIPESQPEDKSTVAGIKSEQVVTVKIDEKLMDAYYNGCCKACFWPLFHSMPDRALFRKENWEAYLAVNQDFARLTFQSIKKLHEEQPDVVPIIWIHDYHLMCCANFIRTLCDEAGLKVKIAFFLHIPFPSWDMMRLFPWDDELLQHILACDSIGFHLQDYCLNFIACCQRRLGCRVDRDKLLISHNMRAISVHPLPIGIHFEKLAGHANEAQTIKNNPQEQILIGVDRLDYTKGLIHKIRAFERFLDKHPEQIEKVVLLQVILPSKTSVKDYKGLKEELDKEIGRIKGRFSTPNWSPIRYLHGYVSQEQLAAFYRDSSVALITPLRDGMNLIAKEFVACQTRDPGVLVLSAFAGASQSMVEALKVNPYETDQFAEIIYRAIMMPNDERELRMRLLRKREKEKDVNFWITSFLETVDYYPHTSGKLEKFMPLREEDFDSFLESHVTECSKLALLLDYDGTLAPIASHPELAILPSETKSILLTLSSMPDVHISIISGRSMDDIKKMVGIKGITYAGNHGLQIEHSDGAQFSYPVAEDHKINLEKLKKLLSNVTEPGAWVEDKGSVLTFHYREVQEDAQPRLLEEVQKYFKEASIVPHFSHKALEARPQVTWNKGRAAIYILRTLFGVDWSNRITTIFAGDDKTDEDAMKALQGMAVTFRVTSSQNVQTYANYRLPSTDSVVTMLKWIVKRLELRPLSDNKKKVPVVK